MKINATPRPHTLNAIENSKISYAEALSELVDNSFDAGASTICIDIHKRTLSVTDDGQGCNDIEAMVALGEHRKSENTRLGRYGVGLKNSAIGLAEMLIIETKGKRHTVDWEEMKRNGWSDYDTKETPSDVAQGMRIGLCGLRTKPQVKRIQESLSFNFAPALWSGKIIEVIGDRLAPWQKPVLESRVELVEESNDGSYGFRLEAGIVDNNPHEPFILSYEHRILGETSEPCGNYAVGSRFFGFVELWGKWPLLKHKDGLRDSSAAEWLYREIAAVCDPLFEQCQRLGENVALQELSAEIDLAISEIRGTARRFNLGGSGSVEPKETGREVREAEVVSGEGDVRKRRGGGGFCLGYYQDSEDHIGRVSTNSARIEVNLNETHPYIRKVKDANNRDAIRAVALSLVIFDQIKCTDPNQRKLKLEEEHEKGMFFEGLTKTLRRLA